MAALTEAEVRDMVHVWYRKLDVHAPLAELLPLVATENAKMVFPEATVYGQEGFSGWYEGVIRRFFDEVHEMKELSVSLDGERADVKLVVNWQAHIWDPPAAKSQWLGFDAAQTWVVIRSPQSGQAVILTYVVDGLAPMPGSAAL